MTTDEKIDCLLEKMDQVRIWQATHNERHDAIAQMLKTHHDELYGVAGSLVPGLKSHVQTMADKVATISPPSRWIRLMDSIIASVASGGAIALMVWLLWMYSQHAKGT